MKVALVENFGADFVGARLRFAIYLKNNGLDVAAIIPNDNHKEIVEKHGIRVLQVDSNIRGGGLSNKITYALHLKRILKAEKFDIVHLYRLQPNLIGTPLAYFYSKSKIINHVTGLGLVFASTGFKNRILKLSMRGFYKLNSFLFSPHIIFQNEQDIDDLGIRKRVYCIRGSAVDEERFKQRKLTKTDRNKKLKDQFGLSLNENDKVAIFVSRLLKQKGVIELIEAVKIFNSNSDIKYLTLIVGWSDKNNPASAEVDDLKERTKGFESDILILGRRSDIEELIALSDISILPTYYREGTPRFLLESMSSGKPIITTNMPGCDHLVSSENPNGLLIKPKSVDAIVEGLDAIKTMDLKLMGKNSAKIYKENFSESIVYNSILNLYKKIIRS